MPYFVSIRVPSAVSNIVRSGPAEALPSYSDEFLVQAPGLTQVAEVRRVSMDNARKSPDDDFAEGDGERFVMSHGLSTPEAEELLKKWGRNELVENASSTWWIIFRQVMFQNILYRPLGMNMQPTV